MGKLQKFQMQKFNGWMGTTKANHMGGIFQRQPQMATNLMVILQEFYGLGRTMDTFLSKFPVKEFESEDEYIWKLIGSSMKNIPLVEARDLSGNIIASDGTAGVGGEAFYLVFGTDWFADQEVIVGEQNEVYPLRVLGPGVNEGTNTRYKVELMGGITTGMPGDELQMGKRFSVEYAPVEREFSRKAGDIRFAAPIEMRNEFTTIRLQHKVPGSMLDEKVAFGVPVYDEKTGKVMVKDMWMHVVQWEFEKQWNMYKNNVLAFGRSNRNLNGEYLNVGKSGEVIRMGAGLFEQMEVSNTDPYNTFSLKRFMDDIYQISRTFDFKDRKFIVKTGELGAIQFSRAALSEGSGWNPITYEYSASELGFLKPVQAKTNPQGGAFRMTAPQVTEFIAPNGAYVKIDVDPFYDDPIRNKIQWKGGPAMSYRYDVFDIGTQEQPNIFKCAVKGKAGDLTGYEWGFRNPFTGQMGNDNMSHDEDSATIHKMTTTGVCVLDPTRTLSYIPALIAG